MTMLWASPCVTLAEWNVKLQTLTMIASSTKLFFQERFSKDKSKSFKMVD